MKLKQLKLKQSVTSLTDSEMKNVIGGTYLDPIVESGVCYYGKCEGIYTYMNPDGQGFRLMCNTPYTDCF